MIDIDLPEYQQAANWSKIPDAIIDEDFVRTVSSHLFPGAILPAITDNGEVIWFAIADDPPTWRKLRPILMAYVGETISPFNGEPYPLRTSDPVENVLLNAGAYAVAKIFAPNGGHQFPLRALSRMVRAFEEKPADLRPAPTSTAMIISRFDMCLIQGDRGGAEQLLERLRTELRLDTLNLLFAEVRLLAAFRDWTSILDASWFQEICRVRKPPAVARYLLEAIWHADLENYEADPDSLQLRFTEHWRDRANSILISIPDNRGSLVSKFRKLNFENAQNDRDDNSTSDQKPQEGNWELRELTLNLPSNASGDADIVDPPAMDEGGTPPEIDEGGWISWLETLDDAQSRGIMDHAREISDARGASTYEDPHEIKALSTALIETNDGIAHERLIAALPTLLSWVKSDEGYPRKAMKPLYETLLTLVSLMDDYGTADREAASEMLSAILEVGVSAEDYRQLIQDISHFVPDGSGTKNVFWLLDLADIISQQAAMNEGERNSLLNRILGSLTPITSLFTPIQLRAYLNVAKIGGWPEPKEAIAKEEDDEISQKLDGKFIGIYTLTERSGRNAAETLRRLTPNVKVEVSSAHDCSKQLQSLSRNADIFVVTTSSATHAATDCINRYRRNENILFAAGKGQCSILRAIEENLG